ncbi:MAG: ABC transporter substrate-binding protein [Clostridium sp.]
MKLKKSLASFLLVAMTVVTVGCSSNEKSKEEDLSLKIGLMPAVDTAPILLAQKKGYFDDLGLKVEVEIYTNAENRQSALQANAIDGAMTDIIALATNVNGGFDIKATTMTDGVFPVLMGKGASDKKDIKVGMMEVSVSNFLIDEWLSDDYNIEKVYINEIPARLAAIGSGAIDMGLFPEPVASNGELNGLEKKVFEAEDGYCPDVMVFTGKALSEKEKAVKLFHEGYNKAVEDINNDSLEALDILMEKIPNVKPEAKDLIVLPTYNKASLPSDEYITKIINWTSEVLKKDLDVKPSDLLQRKFTK